MSLRSIKGEKTALLGFGRSNRAVADALLSHGCALCVYAESPPPPEIQAQYEARGVRFAIGAFPPRFTERVLVRSPVIRPDHPSILASRVDGAELTSETELFLAACACPVIGVTGSDGKTTTAALCAALLRACGKRVLLGGNNGVPLLARDTCACDAVVLELSSFQLMTVEHTLAVAVLTNITPNHLNWHRDMAEYIRAKACACMRARRLVTNANAGITRAIAHSACGQALLFGKRENGADITEQNGIVRICTGKELRQFDCRAFRLPGAFNRENLMAALGATFPVLSDAAVGAALRHFQGEPHRLQLVGRVGGVAYYDSSIDTSPARTAATLGALGSPAIVIAGGRGKGLSLRPLAQTLSQKAKAVCLYGETAQEIAAALVGVPFAVCQGFDAAFQKAAGLARAGDTVLLSPGCTAFDEFEDFTKRGERFAALVAALPRKGKEVGDQRTDP